MQRRGFNHSPIIGVNNLVKTTAAKFAGGNSQDENYSSSALKQQASVINQSTLSMIGGTNTSSKRY